METYSVLSTLITFLFGYLCGSIPFGLIFSKLFGLGDVREIGSGNIGATNVLRTGSKKVAALTLVADMLKGTVPVVISGLIAGVMTNEFSNPAASVAAVGAFLGHLFPIWLKFKGGKGIATYVGLLLAFWWQGLIAFAVVWLTVAWITRYSSLAALCATVAASLAFWAAGRTEIAALFAVLTFIAWFAHRANISRLLAGTEGKIGAKG